MNGRRKIEDGASPENERNSISMSTQSRTEPIHTRYRPRRLSEVIGQPAVVRSLTDALRAKALHHAYLFTGPAGTGKTTLARIVAEACGCRGAGGVIEVDAASNSGVDDVERILAPLLYAGFGESPNKAVILDECHRFSKQAWDKFLKPTEEPPAHVFFFFCSTEPDKVPKALLTRCLAYSLLPVRFDDVMDLLDHVCSEERYETPTRILKMVAQAADGSPRAALTMLAKVHGVTDEEDAAPLLRSVLESPEVIDLCRLMVKGDLDWKRVCEVVKGLQETPPETVRIIVVNYLNACVLGARGEKDAIRLLTMLERFLVPCNPADKMGPILAALGRIVFP